MVSPLFLLVVLSAIDIGRLLYAHTSGGILYLNQSALRNELYF